MERYDPALLGILQSEGNIKDFLHAVFGFLYRRTDFYKIMRSREEKMGFPSGVARKISLAAFSEFETKVQQDERDTEKNAEKKKSQKTEGESGKACLKKKEEPARSKTSAVSIQIHKEPSNVKTEFVNSSLSSNDKLNDPDQNEDILTQQQKVFQSHPESYNGAIRDKYCWTQSITDLDIRFEVPNYVTKGKQVKVKIQRKHLKVSHVGDNGMTVDVVDDDLPWEINTEESMWSLVPGEHVHVNFEKVQERWWEAALLSEPKISVRKIHPERPITDLDDESQAKIEQMMYDDRMKKLGKPTSQEQNIQEMLKKAWDAEGSPFKGQPFDPSKVNIESGSNPLPANLK